MGAEDDALEKAKTAKLYAFFDLVQKEGDKLYILGDLFDFWFEYKYAIPREHLGTIFRLKQLSEAGIEIHYVTGNHDFWLGDFLSRSLGIRIHRGQMEANEQGVRLFLIHGDGLAPADWKYRVFVRSLLQNRLAIFLYKLIPPDWGIPLARAVSSSSRNHTSSRESGFLKDYEKYAKSKLSEGYDAVLIGHTHEPTFQQFDNGIYLNTGDFYKNFSYAKLDDANLTLEWFK